MTDDFQEYLCQLLTGEAGKLSMVQHRIFRSLLMSQSPVFSVDLARELEVSPARIARILTEMEKKNWITRTEDPEDRRRTLIVVTSIGREQAERIHREIILRLDYLKEKIGENDLKTFLEIRSRIRKALKDYPS